MAFAAAAEATGRERRRCDITVFGCTGNAGRGVAYHVLRSAFLLIAHHDHDSDIDATKKLRIGLAGRNRSKVESTLKSLKEELVLLSLSDNNKKNIDIVYFESLIDDYVTILVADSDDESSMNEMAKSSTIVISCAGPFGRYGEACVKACIENQAHYLDITAEVDWITEMINKYESDARKSEVTLLPFSGYDCVPAELGMILTNDALLTQQNQKEGTATIMTLGKLNLAFHSEGGGFPRGTLNTILDGLDGKGKKEVSSSEKQKPNDNKERFYPKKYRSTAKGTLSPTNFLFPKWSSHLGQYTGPNFMAVVNVPILCRSASFIGGPDVAPLTITDREVILSGEPRFWNGYGLFSTLLYIGVLMMSGMALLIRPVRSWLRNKLNSYSFPGNLDGEVVVHAEGIPSSSSSSSKGGDAAAATKSRMKMVVPGDAGIYATGLFTAAVANTLLEVLTTEPSLSSGDGDGDGEKSRRRLPPVGFHSPVAALHGWTGSFVQNLQRLGADISLELLLPASSENDGGATKTKVLDPVMIQSKL